MTFPILSDLGTCVFGQKEYEEVIQAIPYRSPEVVLRMKWNSSVDIWNLGVLVSKALPRPRANDAKLPTDVYQAWELLFAEQLFGNENEQDSLGRMVTYLGPPSTHWLGRSRLRGRYFDDCGETFESCSKVWR